MSYIDVPAGVSQGHHTVVEGEYTQSYMMLDIAALQFIYGADFTSSDELWSGDTIYEFRPDSSSMWVNGVEIESSSANKIYRTIWDGNGTDTYDFSAYSSDLTVDLAPGEWSKLSDAQLSDLDRDAPGKQAPPGNIANALMYYDTGQERYDTRSLIERVTTGSGDDTVYGYNFERSGNFILTQDGNDTIHISGGVNYIDGGNDEDTLVIGGVSSDYDLTVDTGSVGIYYLPGAERGSSDYSFSTVVNVEYFQFDDGLFTTQDFDVYTEDEFTRSDGVEVTIDLINGIVVQRSLYDIFNVRSWDDVAIDYDRNGVIQQRDITYDDGRYTEVFYEEGLRVTSTTYDDENIFAWSSKESSFESGQIVLQVFENDDGSTRTDAYSDGGLVSREKVDEDGDYITTFYDDTDVLIFKDTLSSGILTNNRYIDGVLSNSEASDIDDVRPWETRDRSYQDGELVLDRTILDVGIQRSSYYFDPDTHDGVARLVRSDDINDTRSWSYIEVKYDVSGNVLSRETYADGSDQIM